MRVPEIPGGNASLVISSLCLAVLFMVAFAAVLTGTFGKGATGVTTSGNTVLGTGNSNPQTRSPNSDSPYDMRTYLGVYFSCAATEPISGDMIHPEEQGINFEHSERLLVANGVTIGPQPSQETPQIGNEIGLRSQCEGRPPTAYANYAGGNIEGGNAITRRAETRVVSTGISAEAKVGLISLEPETSHRALENQAEIVKMTGY